MKIWIADLVVLTIGDKHWHHLTKLFVTLFIL